MAARFTAPGQWRGCVLAAWAGLLVSACQGAEPWDGQVTAPDYARFKTEVYPVLLRDCAFGECHGSAGRFFQVWGPGRTRLSSETRVDDEATLAEIQASYARARSMLVNEAPDKLPPLLAKPLEGRAGGIGHRGLDAFGRNIYQSAQDPRYAALLAWAGGVPTTPTPQASATPTGAPPQDPGGGP